ncbi:MAG: CBM96 family carbohydrate-binding protein [Actinomycetota bacterium]
MVLTLAMVGVGTAQALTGTAQPQLTLNHLIRTSPFQGSSTAVRDNEGSAYVASDDALWMASDNDDALFEVDRTTGALRRKVPQSDFINAPRLGVGGSAGQARTEDLEALAYDANADVIYAFSGSTSATPTVYRLTRDANHRFQVQTWQPMPSEWTGAGWRPADGLTYVANGSTIRTYDFATNTFGPSFSISGLSKIFGVDFDDVTGDLLAVNGSERLYRASMTTRTLLPGWNGISLTGLGFLDTRAVEVIGEQLLVTDGADSSARPSSDPMSHAVFVLDVTGPGGPAPTASFTATPTTGTAPLAVNFTDTSSGSPTSWAWNFGDGGTSASPSPSHTYSTTGTYTATLTVTNTQGSSSTSRLITVSTTAVITPSNDAQVNPSGAAVPGSAPSFSADGSPVSDGVLKFNVNVPGQITGAKLRLFCVDSSSVGGTFYAAAETNPPWSEGTVTWATAPVAGASYGSLGAVKSGTWYEVDLTALVTANGTYSLRIKNTSGNGADYVTKEGAAGFAPQLVVTTA